MRRSTQAPPLRSMTGFGRAEARAGSWRIECEARSVNHRFLDLRVSLPEGLADLEETVRRGVQDRAARGRLELRVVAERADGAVPVRVDRGLARSLSRAAREIASLTGVRPGLDAGRLLEFPGLVRVDSTARSAGPAVRRGVLRCALAAMARLDSTRRTEGRYLARDLLRRLGAIERARCTAERLAARLPGEAAGRLRERLRELAAGIDLNSGRLEQEAAILASRADISEELVKLRGLVEQARELLASGRGPVGKRLDFLVQEMNREANTIGSKAAALDITSLCVEMKTEIEKVREQVQNLE